MLSNLVVCPVDCVYGEVFQEQCYTHVCLKDGTAKINSGELLTHYLRYGCKTWSVTLRKKHRLKVFENRALRRIFGLRRNEMAEDWRKLHNEEL
jgi:hypothetical protein